MTGLILLQTGVTIKTPRQADIRNPLRYLLITE